MVTVFLLSIQGIGMILAHSGLTAGVSFRTFNLVQQETQGIMRGTLLVTVVSSVTCFPYQYC